MRVLILLLLISLGACARSSADLGAQDPLMDGPDDLGVDGPLMDPAEAVVAVQQSPKPSRPVPTIAYFPESFYEPSLQCDERVGGLQPVLSVVEKSWYPEQLDAAGEPSLYLLSQTNRPRGQESLRFTWLPTFHHPVVVRIETLDDGNQKLIATRLSGEGGYDPGEVRDRIERMLTPAESRRLEKVLNQTRIFGLPSTLCADGGADGAQWIFEAADASGYHFVHRWSPRKGEARKMGLFLLSLTGWTFETVY